MYLGVYIKESTLTVGKVELNGYSCEMRATIGCLEPIKQTDVTGMSRLHLTALFCYIVYANQPAVGNTTIPSFDDEHHSDVERRRPYTKAIGRVHGLRRDEYYIEHRLVGDKA